VDRPTMPLLWFSRTDYRPPRGPEHPAAPEPWAKSEPQAPLPWWQEGCFLVVEVAAMILGSRIRGPKQVVISLAVAMAPASALFRARTGLERRRAEQLGLTMDTAPMRRIDWSGVVWTAGWRLWLRFRHTKVAPTPWPEQLAQRILSEWYRRRSWNRALARTRAEAPGTPTSPATRTRSAAPGEPGPP
jgi:hypothetical protein